MTDELLGGGCLCGAVRYRARGPWLRFRFCYCSRCRKATGSAHASNLFTAPDCMEWLEGAEHVTRFDLLEAERFGRSFCRRCGSGLPHLLRDGSGWLVPAGSLDVSPELPPQARIFWASRAPWVEHIADSPAYDEYSPG